MPVHSQPPVGRIARVAVKLWFDAVLQNLNEISPFASGLAP